NNCHKIFEQTPNNHISKNQGCPYCTGYKVEFENILRKFIEKHGNKYKYDKFVFKNMITKSIIICNTCHNEFKQTPNNHLKGGCRVCARNNPYTFEKLVNKFNSVHNFKYVYDENSYIKFGQKIKIYCPDHGEFYQKPQHHLNGSNCPK